MKAVLLTTSTGQGHNAAAAAVSAALTERGFSCETLDALRFLGDNAGEAIEGAFVNIAVKTPRAFGFMYQAGEFISSDRRKSPVYYANALYAENLHRYLVEHQVDAAVCTHLFPAEALTFLKRRRELATKTFFVSTDYTCIPFLEETDMDAVFVPSGDLSPLYLKRGVPGDKLFVTGIPVLDKFRRRTGRDEARKTLDLPLDVPAYLIMTGGEGCGDAVGLTRKLMERCKGKDLRCVVMTGHNMSLLETLKRRYANESRMVIVPYTEQVSLYMDACDVLLTKPGGISSTEAAVKGIPIMHTSPIPGCETINAQFFAERGMSILAPTAELAAANTVRLGDDILQMNRIREAQRQYTISNATERIAGVVYDTITGPIRSIAESPLAQVLDGTES